jgi:autotransporter-associated beta strand protein
LNSGTIDVARGGVLWLTNKSADYIGALRIADYGTVQLSGAEGSLGAPDRTNADDVPVAPVTFGGPDALLLSTATNTTTARPFKGAAGRVLVTAGNFTYAGVANAAVEGSPADNITFAVQAPGSLTFTSGASVNSVEANGGRVVTTTANNGFKTQISTLDLKSAAVLVLGGGAATEIDTVNFADGTYLRLPSGAEGLHVTAEAAPLINTVNFPASGKLHVDITGILSQPYESNAMHYIAQVGSLNRNGLTDADIVFDNIDADRASLKKHFTEGSGYFAFQISKIDYYKLVWKGDGNTGDPADNKLGGLWYSNERPDGNWLVGVVYSNWVPTILGPEATNDIFVLWSSQKGDSRTVTIPNNADGTPGIVHLDGARYVGATPDFSGWSSNAGSSGPLLNLPGLLVTVAADTAQTGNHGDHGQDGGTHWTIEGGILDTGLQQPDRYYAIFVNSADYAYNNANLNIKSVLTGGGNIRQRHAGADAYGFSLQGDASQFNGTIVMIGGGRNIGFSGNVRLGEALVISSGTMRWAGITGNAVVGATFRPTAGYVDFEPGANGAIAFTGGTYSGVYNGNVPQSTISGAGFWLESGTFYMRQGALGEATALLGDLGTATLQFIPNTMDDGTAADGSRSYSTAPFTGTIQLYAGARILVGTDSFRWVRGTPEEYGLPPDTAPVAIYPKSFEYDPNVGDPITVTFTGAFTGTTGLIKDGPGTLIYAPTVNYANTVTIAGGTLSIANELLLTGNGSISGGTLRLTGLAGTTYAKRWAVSGAARLEVPNGGALSVPYSGSGTLTIDAPNGLALLGTASFPTFALALTDGTTLTLANDGSRLGAGVTLAPAASVATILRDNGGRTEIAGVIDPRIAVELAAGDGAVTGTLALFGSAGTVNTHGGFATLELGEGVRIETLNVASDTILRPLGGAPADGSGPPAVQDTVPTITSNLSLSGDILLNLSAPELVLQFMSGSEIQVLRFAPTVAGTLPTYDSVVLLKTGTMFDFDWGLNDSGISATLKDEYMPLAWTGAENNTWSADVGGGVNWWNTLPTLATALRPVRFSDAKIVVFRQYVADDFDNGLATGTDADKEPFSTNILVSGVVRPGFILVDTSGGFDFTFGASSGGGSIAGEAMLFKVGAGVATFEAGLINTYSGGTLLREGKIIANNATSLGSGVVSLSDSTELDIGAATLNNALKMDKGAAVKINGTTAAALTLGGALSGGGWTSDGLTRGLVELTGQTTITLGGSGGAYEGTLRLVSNGTQAAFTQGDWGNTAFELGAAGSSLTNSLAFNSTTGTVVESILANSGLYVRVADAAVLDVASGLVMLEPSTLTNAAPFVIRGVSVPTFDGPNTRLTSSAGRLELQNNDEDRNIFIRVRLANAGAVPLTVVKTGPGTVTINAETQNTGGFIVEEGVLEFIRANYNDKARRIANVAGNDFLLEPNTKLLFRTGLSSAGGDGYDDHGTAYGNPQNHFTIKYGAELVRVVNGQSGGGPWTEDGIWSGAVDDITREAAGIGNTLFGAMELSGGTFTNANMLGRGTAMNYMSALCYPVTVKANTETKDKSGNLLPSDSIGTVEKPTDSFMRTVYLTESDFGNTGTPYRIHVPPAADAAEELKWNAQISLGATALGILSVDFIVDPDARLIVESPFFDAHNTGAVNNYNASWADGNAAAGETPATLVKKGEGTMVLLGNSDTARTSSNGGGRIAGYSHTHVMEGTLQVGGVGVPMHEYESIRADGSVIGTWTDNMVASNGTSGTLGRGNVEIDAGARLLIARSTSYAPLTATTFKGEGVIEIGMPDGAGGTPAFGYTIGAADEGFLGTILVTQGRLDFPATTAAPVNSAAARFVGSVVVRGGPAANTVTVGRSMDFGRLYLEGGKQVAAGPTFTLTITGGGTAAPSVYDDTWADLPANTSIAGRRRGGSAGTDIIARTFKIGGTPEQALVLSLGTPAEAEIDDLRIGGSFELSNAILRFDFKQGTADNIILTGGASNLVITDSSNVIKIVGNAATWPAGIAPIHIIQTPNALTFNGALVEDANDLFTLDTSDVAYGASARIKLGLSNATNDDSAATDITLSIAVSAGSLFWRGKTSEGAVWDTNPGHLYWEDAGGTSVAYGGLAEWSLVFDDVAGTDVTRDVAVTTVARAFGISVNNPRTNYIFTNTGVGKLTGDTVVTKEGAGKLTLTATNGLANDITGEVNIYGGTIELKQIAGAPVVPLIAGAGVPSLLGAGLFNGQRGASYQSLVFANGATLRFNGLTRTDTDRAFTLTGGGGRLEVASTAAGTRVWFKGAVNGYVHSQGAGTNILELSGDGGADPTRLAAQLDYPGMGWLSGVGWTPPGYDVSKDATYATTAGGVFTLKLSGNTGVRKTGAGVWVLDGDNDFAGDISIVDGVLGISRGEAVGSGNLIRLYGGALAPATFDIGDTERTTLLGVVSDVTIDARLDPRGGDIWVPQTGGHLTVTGALVTEAGVTEQLLVKTGAGTLSLAGMSGGYMGDAVVYAGVLEARTAAPVGPSSLVSVNSGAFFLLSPAVSVQTVNIGGIAGAGFVGIGVNRTSGLTLQLRTPESRIPTFTGFLADSASGITSGPLSVVKSGEGTQVFGGYYLATGTLRIEQGVWRLDGSAYGSNALGTGLVSVTPLGNDPQLSGTLDIFGYDFAGRGPVEIVGAGYRSQGAATDSFGGGAFPALTLTGNAAVTTAGASVLSVVTGAYTLHLESTEGVGAGVSAVFRVLGPGYVGASEIHVAADSVLMLEALERLTDGANYGAGVTPPEGVAVLRLDPGATLYLAGDPAHVTQTFRRIVGESGSETSAGSIAGFGLARIRGVEAAAEGTEASRFWASIDGDANFEVFGAGTLLELANASSTTRGTITAAGGAAILVRQPIYSGNDVFGGAVIELRDGTLRFAIPTAVVTPTLVGHDFLFSGTRAEFQSDGAPVTISGGRTYYGEHAGSTLDAGIYTPTTYFAELSGTGTRDAVNVFALYLSDPEHVSGSSLQLVKSGVGTWEIYRGKDRNGSSRDNSYTGGTLVNGGTLRLGEAGAVPANTALELYQNGAYFDLNGFNLTVSSLTGGSGTLSNDSAVINTNSAVASVFTWTVASDATSQVRLGSIVYGKTSNASPAIPANNFSFVKDGAGRLLLMNMAYYTGETFIKQGVLAIGRADAAVRSDLIRVGNGATFDFSALPTWTVTTGKTLQTGSASLIDASDTQAAHYDLEGGTLRLEGGTLVLGVNDPNAIGDTQFTHLSGNLTVARPSGLVLNLGTYAGSDPSSYLAVDGVVTLDATIALTLNHVNGYITPGEFPFLRYSGELAGAFAGDAARAFTQTPALIIDPRYTFTVKVVEARSEIVLDVESTVDADLAIRWAGGVIGGPEVVWAGGDYKNFTDKDYTAKLAYGPAAYAIFDDTAQGYDVLVAAEGVIIGAAGIAFINNANDYTLTAEMQTSGGVVRAGAIDGTGYIAKSGTATLKINNANVWRALEGMPGFILDAGTLSLGNDAALGTGPLLVNGGTLTKNNDADGLQDRRIENKVVVAANARAVFDSGDRGVFELAGELAGDANAAFTKTGRGVLLLSGDATAYAGSIVAKEGILGLAQNGDFSRASVTLDGVGTTLQLSGHASDTAGFAKVGALAGGAGTVVTSETLGDKTLEVGARGEDTVYRGVFGKADGTAKEGVTILLTKVGSGTLTLAGDSRGLNGAVDVREGTLRFGDGSAPAEPASGLLAARAGARIIFDLQGDRVLPAAQRIVTEAAVLAPESARAPAGIFEKRGEDTLSITSPNLEMNGKTLVSAGVLRLAGQDGSAGHSELQIEAGAQVVLSHGDNPFTFDNALSGAGTLVKADAGSAVWLGTSTATGQTLLNAGSLQFGDGVAALPDQRHPAAIITADETELLFVVRGADVDLGRKSDTLTVGGVYGSGQLIKTGAGLARLMGAVSIHNVENLGQDIWVREGTLQFGDGEGSNSRAALDVWSSVRVENGAVFSVARTGTVTLREAVDSSGEFRARGDNNGGGHVILASAYNQISGTLAVVRNVAVEVGAGSRLNDGLPENALEVTLDPNATLRFMQVSGATGNNLSLVSANPANGGGVIEYAGGGTLAFNSIVAGGGDKVFTGVFLASKGTFALDALLLPAQATFDARETGVVLIEASGVTDLDAKFGTGNGTVRLGTKATATSASYSLAEGTEFPKGTIAVAAKTELKLTPVFAMVPAAAAAVAAGTAAAEPAVIGVEPVLLPSLTAGALRVESGGRLAGAGIVSGSLQNLYGGTVAPGTATSWISVQGDFVNAGNVTLDVSETGDFSTLNYTGAAVLANTGSLTLRLKRSAYESVPPGTELRVIVDDVPAADGSANISGNFPQHNLEIVLTNDDGLEVGRLVGKALTYNKGDGALTLRFGENFGDFGGLDVPIHKDLGGYQRYFTEILLGDDVALKGVVGRLQGAQLGQSGVGAIGRAVNGGSPLGFAAMSAMPAGMARADTTALRSHLESLRYGNAGRTALLNLQPYIMGSGLLEQNDAHLSSEAFDFRSYGGMVGADANLGRNLVFGASAGYGHGDATLEYGAGKIRQEHEKLTFYGTYMFSDKLYLDASVFAGLSQYRIRQTSVSGTGKASPDGYNFGASVYGGTVFALNDKVSFTPFVGLEYSSVHVDGFEQTGHEAAWRTQDMSQDSLRARVGSGVSWTVPSQTDAFLLRVGFEVAYSHEILDPDAEITASLAADRSGRTFRTDAPALPLHLLQVGPTVDLEFAEDATFELSYRFEYDFKYRTNHTFNAGFRFRFGGEKKPMRTTD